MFKLLMIITFILPISESHAAPTWQLLRESVAALGGMIAGKSIIHVKNESGHPIRVGTSEQGQSFTERVGTLIVKGFQNDAYDILSNHGSEDYQVDKDSGYFTVAAQYHYGHDPRFTYCKVDTSKPSHTLVFKHDGGLFINGLKCHDETR